MKPKVVQVAAIDYSIVKLLANLNEKTKKAGYEVHIITSEGPYKKQLESQGYIVHNVDIERKIKPMSNLKSVLNIMKILKQIRPEILHVHTPIASVLARIAGKLAKVSNIIYTAHGFYFHDDMPKKKYKLFFGIEKFMGKYFTDFIFTQSKEDYDLAVNNKFRPEDRMLWISNGVDLEYEFNFKNFQNLLEMKQKLDFKDSDFIVTFVGRLVEEKGILDLLKASEELSENIKIVVVGEFPEKERDATINEKIEEFSNRENVIFTGQIDNINEYLFISDVFCLPSYREGMPRSIIEAMAMKNAIIATNIRGSREEVLDGVSGFLVDIKREDLIRDKIIQLYNNQDLLESMKLESYKRAHKLYNENDVIEKQLSVFESVIKK
ncbi:glycosyltransferase family 4 protein [Salinicoccus sp. HZC-1]|uniref:glycosyltransferase family 4 protein n=1 Tax=Salinicoccus sp. HZC-1 TaxID=3385497 RepID=UPI00398B05EF